MSEPQQGAAGGLRVDVRLLGLFAEMAGVRRLALSLPADAKLGSALRALDETFARGAGAGAAPQKSAFDAVVFVNGRNAAHGGGAERPLRDGDSIVLTTPIGGG